MSKKRYKRVYKLNREDVESVGELAEKKWGGWAKWLLGAIVGALVAGGVITLSGCGATVTVASEQGMLQVQSDGKIIIIPAVMQDGKK